MQGGRTNTGSRTVPASGRMATRLPPTAKPQQAPFKPNEYGMAHAADAGRIEQPQPSTSRPQPATPVAPTSARPIAQAGHDELIRHGQEIGTPVQHVLPPAPVATPNPNAAVSPNTGAWRPSGPG